MDNALKELKRAAAGINHFAMKPGESPEEWAQKAKFLSKGVSEVDEKQNWLRDLAHELDNKTEGPEDLVVTMLELASEVNQLLEKRAELLQHEIIDNNGVIEEIHGANKMHEEKRSALFRAIQSISKIFG